MRTLITAFISALIFSVPVLSQATQNPHPPRPRSINYIEGEASIGKRSLKSNSVGSIELDRGQSLTAQTGKVEILLTPGVLLRLVSAKQSPWE